MIAPAMDTVWEDPPAIGAAGRRRIAHLELDGFDRQAEPIRRVLDLHRRRAHAHLLRGAGHRRRPSAVRCDADARLPGMRV